MIKKFKEFILEEISGTEIPQKTKGSYFGPAYGDTESPNTISQLNTSLSSSPGSKNPNSKNDLTGELYTIDDYKDLHTNYLKGGGSETELTGEKDVDISIMVNFLNNQ